MFDESLVTIIFKLLNFAALLGLGFFIFKRYFQNDIIETIENTQLEEINLNTRISELGMRGSELSREIIDQEKLCDYLKDRTDQWNEAFKKDVEYRRQCQKVLDEHMAERTDKQINSILQERMRRAILPEALKQVHSQLVESFESKSQGKEFVQNILDYMKKSS